MTHMTMENNLLNNLFATTRFPATISPMETSLMTRGSIDPCFFRLSRLLVIQSNPLENCGPPIVEIRVTIQHIQHLRWCSYCDGELNGYRQYEILEIYKSYHPIYIQFTNYHPIYKSILESGQIWHLRHFSNRNKLSGQILFAPPGWIEARYLPLHITGQCGFLAITDC